ncbi:uncharacterized protein LOC106668204 [Cimex lectularius]|uniref:Uncharacterized protein n=1 Tax=Cimex lectularius TaxID=79782 RepID=A0A8I6RYL3_CIMLE|nr:uncharacterized protein LOC106668204 [Cimex lectularius]
MGLPLFLLLLLANSNSSSGNVTDLQLDIHQFEYGKIRLEMYRLNETIETFAKEWNTVKEDMEEVKREIYNGFVLPSKTRVMTTTENYYSGQSYHGNSYARTEPYELKVRDMMVNPIETYINNITEGTRMLQKRMAAVKSLVELQMKMGKDHETTNQWAIETVRALEQSLEKLVKKSKDGIQIIQEVCKQFLSYNFRVRKADDMTFKNQVCSMPQEYYQFFCQTLQTLEDKSGNEN